jgi:uncharacterized membrane protein YedE/YeeE
MSIWWSELIVLQQISFVIAVVTTIVMFLYLLLIIFGIEDMESFDDVCNVYEGNDEKLTLICGLQLFSFRSVFAFLCAGGWMVYILAPIVHAAISILLGILSGIAAVYLLALAFREAMKLEYNDHISEDGHIVNGFEKDKYMSHSNKSKKRDF